MQFEKGTTSSANEKKYKGVRRRSWGKWVSEIRVPGSRERLWLGSYANPEAAAVAHDTAVFFLRGPRLAEGFNFPDRVGGLVWTGLSPSSVQKVASDSGMAVDAELAIGRANENERKKEGDGRERSDRGSGSGCDGMGDWNGDVLLEDMDFYVQFM